MAKNIQIEQNDLNPILANSGIRTWAQILNQADRRGLLWILAHYIHFSSVFGSGVASLAGVVGSRKDLFKDPLESIRALADRSIEVAAVVFYAAIDEFGEGTTAHRVTHRSMAQATLRATAQFFGRDLDTININSSTLHAVSGILKGYGVNRAMDEHELFYGIGFHWMSETLADQEFQILKEVLETKQPELVKHFGSTDMVINGEPIPAYRWIQLHAIVEAEHAAAALKAANLALKYYAGKEDPKRVRQRWILDGAKGFAEVHAGFMRGLRS